MNNLINSDVFAAGAQMVIVPISTAATISDSFHFALEENDIHLSPRKKNYELGEIEVHIIQRHPVIKYLCFACSVNRNESSYKAIGSIGERIALASKRFKGLNRIAIPLLGTGAGRLNHFESLNVLFNSFYKRVRTNVELIFCVPGQNVFNELKKFIFTDQGVNIFRIKELIIANLKTRSKQLDLGNCGIQSLEHFPELFECVHLEELILSNEWGEFYLGHWVRRKSINKGAANRVISLPAEFKKLKKLKVLICGGDWRPKRSNQSSINKWRLKDISIVNSLSELIVLNLSNNEIEDARAINKLPKLKKLYLNNNQISSFPKITKESSLDELYLSNNKLTNVDFLRNALSLKTVDLHSNEIADLTPLKTLISKIGIKDSRWSIDTINIAQNPLQIPTPEVISQGKEKVLAYFKQLGAEKSINLKPFINRDIKLILVGNSNAGKSTLLHWLKHKAVARDIGTTHWMIVDKWQTNYQSNNYTIRTFDFGGQEYYHDTHHLFFTNKTAYIVLWEDETNHFDDINIEQKQIDGTVRNVKIQTFPITYWLDSINFHTKRKGRTVSEREVENLLDERDKAIDESIKSGTDWTKHVTNSVNSISELVRDDENILVVQNKIDSKKGKIFINQEILKGDYKKIFDFTSISVWNQIGLSVFEETLFQVLNKIPLIGHEYLGTWGIIKSRIENEDFENPFTLDQFKNYCNEIIRGVPQVRNKSAVQINKVLFNDQDAQSFAQYLNDIGILLYYPEHAELQDKIFLNQKKVLGNIYKILLGLNSSYGQFNVSNVIQNLKKEVADEEVLNTINLMLHFKIIFQHPSLADTYIAPLYLPIEPIESIKLFTPLFHKPVYRYEYRRFIYKNVILDFFHNYGRQAMKESVNADHYYYWKNGIVLRDEVTGEIIMVKFFPAKKQDLSAHIDVYKINKSLSEVFLNKVIDDLDCINQDWEVVKTVTANGEDFVPLSVIHENEENENWIFQYSSKYFKLVDFKKYFKKPIKMKKVFISYSKLDFALVAKFLEHLSALQLDGKVAHWYCSELIVGTEWDKNIQKHFDEADIICFMISPNFMKTKYIHEHEIANAFEKKAKDPGFKIVPIILDFCRWSTTKNDLSQFTALPYTAKPVVDFDNQNMAWYIIEECLRLMIDEDLNPVGEDFYRTQKLPSDVQKIYARIVDGKVDKNSA